MSVAARSPEGASFPVGAFVRASSLHVGAAAAAAALRRDLVDKGRLPASAFDEAYAVARVTPGTNLLAMYALLGVFAWAIVRLGRPQLQQHRRRGVALAVTTLVMTWLVPIPQFVILIVAGGLGAAFMRTDS